MSNNEEENVLVTRNETENEEQTKNTVKRFCFALFGKLKSCENIECKYNHNVDQYLEYYSLKVCPNNCGNFCKTSSKSCSKCVTKWIEQKNTYNSQKSFSNEREPRKCASDNCNEITRYYLCRQCNEIKRISIVKK